MARVGLDCPYEASDEASESELLDRSLSVWRGRGSPGGADEFAPIPLDLHTASSIGQYDSVRSIIQRGDQDLNAKNRGGWTALMYACYIGHDNVVNLLLDAGVSVNVKNNKGQTPLMLAASCGNESVSFFLIQQGGELEARDKKSWTALFHATYSGHQNMVKFLLENNANMEAREPSNECTPFMVAAAEGHEIIVQYFLQHGVSVNAKASNGDTARSLALIYGHTKIVSLIDNHTVGVSPALRAEAAQNVVGGDLSSSDEAIQRPPRHSNQRHGRRSSRTGGTGPSIRDGPEAFAKLIDRGESHNITNPDSYIPIGYVTFKNDGKFGTEPGQIRSRDVTSPIDPDDHSGCLDSSGDKDSIDYDDDTNAFSKTGALTIKSSSSSSGGLIAALGISREGSVESNDDLTSDSNSVKSDPGQRSRSPGIAELGQGHSTGEPSEWKKKTVQSQGSRPAADPNVGPGSDRVAPPAVKQEPSTVLPYPPPSTQIAHQGVLFQPAAYIPGNASNNQPLPVTMTTVGVLPEHVCSNPPVTAPPMREYVQGEGHVDARPHDLPALLEELGLSKYKMVFEEQDVDLQVFLSLTDNDLKEIGIKLFGPRRKMTNAIARWHSNAPCSRCDLEQVYADKLEAGMQDMAIQLHQAYDQVEHIKAQLLQERELRSVTESCLMEDRAAWQQVRRVATETHQCLVEVQDTTNVIRCYQDVLSRRWIREAKPITEQNTLVAAIQEGLSLDDRSLGQTNEIVMTSTELLLSKVQACQEEVRRTVAMAMLNTEKLLGRNVEYNNVKEGLS